MPRRELVRIERLYQDILAHAVFFLLFFPGVCRRANTLYRTLMPTAPCRITTTIRWIFAVKRRHRVCRSAWRSSRGLAFIRLVALTRQRSAIPGEPVREASTLYLSNYSETGTCHKKGSSPVFTCDDHM